MSAVVESEHISLQNIQIPQDLYIPPDAMQVVLELFQGPLDLLLYLIRKHNLDILNIPVAKITHQYMEYIELMDIMRIDLAADYLEMAAVLIEIKSRMLLPKSPIVDEEEADPRAELVRRLQEYEQIKSAARELDDLPRCGRDFFQSVVMLPEVNTPKPMPQVYLEEVLLAFKEVLKRADLQTSHNIERESLSVREKMSQIINMLDGERFINFAEFFNYDEGRAGIVATFLAILEMAREWIIDIVQAQAYMPIYVRLRVNE